MHFPFLKNSRDFSSLAPLFGSRSSIYVSVTSTNGMVTESDGLSFFNAGVVSHLVVTGVAVMSALVNIDVLGLVICVWH